MARDFVGKSVLVTGAASGIGRAAARLYARHGGTVFLADVDEVGLAETQQLIRKEDGVVHVCTADVSQEHQITALISQIMRKAGGLDVAFNNAGISGGSHAIEDYPTEEFDKVVAINLRSIFLSMKYEIPAMLQSGGGAIVNTASAVALNGAAGTSAYVASKHGVHGLTRVAAVENAGRGIRINSLAPGWTDTPMAAANCARNPSRADLVRDAIPARRGAAPQELAAAAVWLSSGAANYVVGHMLVVDGGMAAFGAEFRPEQ